MSTHSVDIIEIGDIFQHPNADKLAITNIWGWQCCIGKDQFKKGDKALYVQPDYVVPLSHPSFAFLKNSHNEGRKVERIKVRRFRGQLSQGLLIKVPDEYKDLPVGTNLITELGIERYEPPMDMSTGGMFVGGPGGLYTPKFDLESLQRYLHLFVKDEPVILTEKLHGTSGRYVFSQDSDGEWKQFCGSRTNWMKEDETNIWWLALRSSPDITRWCKDHPHLILYGEVIGHVKRFWYKQQRNVTFAGFAILNKQQWINYDECQKLIEGYDIKWVPLIYNGPFDFEKIKEFAEGPSAYPGADNIREGVVVVPVCERNSTEIGRLALKCVSNVFLENH